MPMVPKGRQAEATQQAAQGCSPHRGELQGASAQPARGHQLSPTRGWRPGRLGWLRGPGWASAGHGGIVCCGAADQEERAQGSVSDGAPGT